MWTFRSAHSLQLAFATTAFFGRLLCKFSGREIGEYFDICIKFVFAKHTHTLSLILARQFVVGDLLEFRQTQKLIAIKIFQPKTNPRSFTPPICTVCCRSATVSVCHLYAPTKICKHWPPIVSSSCVCLSLTYRSFCLTFSSYKS